MRRRLPWFDRRVSGFIRWMTRVSTGYDIGELADELVRTHGPRKVWEHLGACAKINKALAERYGEFDAQLVLALAGVLSGCRYCSIGHMYSANLILFRDQEQLGPIDEARMVELMRKTDREVYDAMLQMLAGEQFEQSRDILSRLWRFHLEDGELRDPDDHLLRASLDVWSWAHECSIIFGVEAEPGGVAALGLMRPRQALLKAYAEAREQQRSAQ